MPRTQTERQKIRDEHLDSWIAVNEGDTLMGKVTDVTEAWSQQRRDPKTGRPGSFYPLLTVQAEDATGYRLPRELKLHAFGAVLFNEIMRKQPRIGERIRVTYKGTGEAKEGQNPPELYQVRTESNASAEAAYARIGGGMMTGAPQAPPSDAPPVPPDAPQQTSMDEDDIPF